MEWFIIWSKLKCYESKKKKKKLKEGYVFNLLTSKGAGFTDDLLDIFSEKYFSTSSYIFYQLVSIFN